MVVTTGESFCRILKVSGGTSRTAVGGTCQGLTGGCRPSVGGKGPGTRGVFRRMARTCRILKSPGGQGLCSRCNPVSLRTNFSPRGVGRTRCKGPFRGKKFCRSCSSKRPNGKCRRFRFSNSSSVSSVLSGLFKGGNKFRKAKNFNKEDKFKDAKRFNDNFNKMRRREKRGVRARMPVDFRRTMFNYSGEFALSSDSKGDRGFRIRVPTNVTGKRSIHLGKGKRGKCGKGSKSLLVGIGIKRGSNCRQGNRSICAAIGVPCAATILKKRVGVRALCKSIIYGVGPNARSKTGVQLGKGNMTTVGGPTIRKSRCTRIRVRIPARLSRATGRGLRRCTQTYD